MNVTAFLPLEIKRLEQEPNFSVIGLILSMYQLSYLLMFLLPDKTFKKIGSKRLMITGYFTMTVATFGFGIL